MAPQPLITPPPTRPLIGRQSDPYSNDLNSLYAALSSLNAELSTYDFSSFFAELSSAAEYDYSSFFAQYSTRGSYDYSSLLAGLTAIPSATGRRTISSAKPTGTSIGANNGANNGGESGGGGMSTGAKIGIGVAVPLIVLLLAGLGIWAFCAGKSKGKKKATTIVAPMTTAPPPQQQYQAQPHMYAQNQGYLPGYQQQSTATPPPQFQQLPPQYVQPQGADPNAGLGSYAKGPAPGVVELETEYHFARGGAVEIGDSTAEQPVEDKKGWRKMIGRKPVPGS